MFKRCARFAFLAALALAVGEPLSLAARSAWAEEPRLNPDLVPLLRYFELGMKSGRIFATSPHRDRRLESQATVDDRRERLSITLSGEATTISYELATNDRLLSFEVIDGKQAVLRRQAKDDDSGAFLEFHQPPSGPVSLRMGEGAQETTYEAENFWRLLAAEPEICRSRLVPLVELLKPEWGLAQTATAAEQALYDSVRILNDGEVEAWQKLVEDLGDPRFSRRRAADRQLRAVGHSAALFLMLIDGRRLDAEQHSRIRIMFDDLSGDGRTDAPDRIALWLAREPRVWLTLLACNEESQRRFAAAQLERLLNARIAFDPAAERSIRDAQLEALRRQRLESSAPAPPR